MQEVMKKKSNQYLNQLKKLKKKKNLKSLMQLLKIIIKKLMKCPRKKNPKKNLKD